jgi:hypothetical protein
MEFFFFFLSCTTACSWNLLKNILQDKILRLLYVSSITVRHIAIVESIVTIHVSVSLLELRLVLLRPFQSQPKYNLC